MSGRTEQLETWWNGLSASERVAALRAKQSGSLDEGTRKSLENAGIIDRGSASGEHDALAFLKTRHD